MLVIHDFQQSMDEMSLLTHTQKKTIVATCGCKEACHLSKGGRQAMLNVTGV